MLLCDGEVHMFAGRSDRRVGAAHARLAVENEAVHLPARESREALHTSTAWVSIRTRDEATHHHPILILQPGFHAFET